MRGIADHDIFAIAADASPARWFGSFIEVGEVMIRLPLFLDQFGFVPDAFPKYTGKLIFTAL